jgi:hypothetical protein
VRSRPTFRRSSTRPRPAASADEEMAVAGSRAQTRASSIEVEASVHRFRLADDTTPLSRMLPDEEVKSPETPSPDDAGAGCPHRERVRRAACRTTMRSTAPSLPLESALDAHLDAARPCAEKQLAFFAFSPRTTIESRPTRRVDRPSRNVEIRSIPWNRMPCAGGPARQRRFGPTPTERPGRHRISSLFISARFARLSNSTF